MKSTPTIRTRLVVLVFALVLPMIAVSAVGAILLWRADRAAMEQDLLRRAQALAAVVARELDLAEVTLRTLATSPYLETGDLQSFQSQIVRTPRTEGARIVLSDRSGQMLVHSHLPFGAKLPRRGDPAISEQVFASGQTQISDLYFGSVTGAKLIAVDVPVLRDGRVVYDLDMGFPPDILGRVLDEQKPPGSGSIAVILDGQGLIVARRPGADEYVGRKPPLEAQRAFREGDSGVFRSPSFDGKPLVAAFSRLPRSHWTVVIGIEETAVTGGLWSPLAIIAASGGGLLLLGLLAALFQSRRIAVAIESLAAAPGAATGTGVREVEAAAHVLAGAEQRRQQAEATRAEREEALRESETRLRLAIDAARAGIWEWDLPAKAVRVDSRAAEICRGTLPAGQWLASAGPELGAWRGSIRAEDRERLDTALAGLREGRIAVCDIEYCQLHPGEAASWVLLHGVVLARDSAGGAPVRILGIVQDASARHEADRERQQLLRTLDLAPFMATDMDGTIRNWSKGAEKLYGWTGAEAVGANVRTLLHTGFSVPRAEINAALLATREWSGDLLRRRRDGAVITVAVHKALDNGTEGRPVVVVESSADITALRQAQHELERLNLELEARVRDAVAAFEAAQTHLAQAQKLHALGGLAGGIAHDFNNILQAIASAAELVEHDATDLARVHRFVRTVLDATGRGASITNRLLVFSRQGTLQLAPLDVPAVLGSIREVLEHTLGSAIEVEVSVEADLPPVLTDRGQLETALVNLATNARDAMPGGGRIVLAAAAETVAEGSRHPAGLAPGDYVRISVADTGAGMDTDVLARAAEPFFTTKPPGQGTGLGLAMVRGFTEQAGGGSLIASVVGKGTTVDIWLPAAADPAAPVPSEGVAVVAGCPSGPRRVLLVDDDELVLETAAEWLEYSGYLVQTAASGMAALALLETGVAVDILVTDLSMPGMNGIATIREARWRRPGLPALLLTGHVEDSVATAEPPGSFVLLRKPVAGSVLTEQIEAAIGRREAVA